MVLALLYYREMKKSVYDITMFDMLKYLYFFMFDMLKYLYFFMFNMMVLFRYFIKCYSDKVDIVPIMWEK